MAKFGLPDNTCLSYALLFLACCCRRCSARLPYWCRHLLCLLLLWSYELKDGANLHVSASDSGQLVWELLLLTPASQQVGEMTCRYSATDHTKFNKTGHEKHCPPEAICENCMPVRNGTKEVETCWAVKTPILYKLNSWHKLLNGSHGQARADPCELLCNVYIYVYIYI